MGPWHLLDGPAWERLTWTLLHFLWQGLLIVAGGEILLALLRLKQAQPRYAILVAGLALMAFCPLATFLLLDIPGAGAVADPGPQALRQRPRTGTANRQPPRPRKISPRPFPLWMVRCRLPRRRILSRFHPGSFPSLKKPMPGGRM